MEMITSLRRALVIRNWWQKRSQRLLTIWHCGRCMQHSTCYTADQNRMSHLTVPNFKIPLRGLGLNKHHLHVWKTLLTFLWSFWKKVSCEDLSSSRTTPPSQHTCITTFTEVHLLLSSDWKLCSFISSCQYTMYFKLNRTLWAEISKSNDDIQEVAFM